jgi:hypothetical protein
MRGFCYKSHSEFQLSTHCYFKGEQGSSVSAVSGYGLDGEGQVRSPAEAKNFPSNLCVQTGSGVHPASCKMDTGGHFLGDKARRGVTLATHTIYCRGRE